MKKINYSPLQCSSNSHIIQIRLYFNYQDFYISFKQLKEYSSVFINLQHIDLFLSLLSERTLLCNWGVALYEK